MTKNTGKGVGDSKSPALMATEGNLRGGAEHAKEIQADTSPPAIQCSPISELISLKSSDSKKTTSLTCRQKIWFSVFFDGTGNNRNADVNFFKHSNIAKLYRAHKDEASEKGIYAIYIPGVGTYFPEIGDSGGSVAGMVAGEMGEARINYALMEMDKRLRRHIELARAPSNAISEINVAVFGFSRGAALARAFVNKLLETRCRLEKHGFVLSNGNWPVRIRFMGLFDTVASVGQPMSSNTTDTWGAVRSNIERLIRKRLEVYTETRPQSLAFAKRGLPGADPAPGKSHGHSSYGGSLAINQCVEEVRHFIAGHEMRNSFPVDSVSILEKGRITKPAHFHETVYPGVHSDVGGSYAPDEGGKSKTAMEKFGLIPLAHMYHFALRAGVPLLNPGAWEQMNNDDFSTDGHLTATYDDYVKKINASGTLGQVFNNHMQHYFAWRFRSIHLKQSGDKSQSIGIAAASSKFTQVRLPIDAKLATLQASVDSADMQVSDLENQVREHKMDGDTSQGDVTRLTAELVPARARFENARQAFLKEKARKDSLPDMTKLQSRIDLYDRQLMLDVAAILAALKPASNRRDIGPILSRTELRPHYRILVDAYEAEFVHKKGLTDKAIIAFFNDYIHDSLSGFGKDATIPSDPRVVYLGGDEKFAYAGLATDTGDAQLA